MSKQPRLCLGLLTLVPAELFYHVHVLQDNYGLIDEDVRYTEESEVASGRANLKCMADEEQVEVVPQAGEMGNILCR